MSCFVKKKYSSTNEHEKLTHAPAHQQGWSKFMVLAAVATTLGSSLPVGYNIGVINTPQEVLKSFCNESVISHYDARLSKAWLNVLWSSVVSIFIVGGCTGSILGAFLADKCGRKKATLVTNVLFILGAVMFLFARDINSVEMLVLGRLLVGLAAGLTTSIVPMYLAELGPPQLSGALGVICPMGVNVGVLIGQVMGLDFLLGAPEHWPYLLSVYAVLVALCLPLVCILPESPKFLYVIMEDKELAIKELSRVRGMCPNQLSDEVGILRREATAAAAAGTEGGMFHVTRDPRLMLPLLLVASMQAGQQTSGINAVFYYSKTIFEGGGLSPYRAQLATVGCGAVNVCTAALMVRLLPRARRRLYFLASTAAAAAFLAGLAVAMTFMKVWTYMPYVCMVGVLGYVLAYGFGLGPIPYFIASELFEVRSRGAGMAWGSLASWTGNFLVGIAFPSARDAIGAYCFVIFALVTAALWIFQFMYLPETSGKTPSEVAELCSRGFASRSRPRPADNDL